MLTADKLRGLLLGTAVGDALGLPLEGLSPAQIRNFGWIKNSINVKNSYPPTLPCRHRLILGRGMISDDTEHALFVAQCLGRFPNDVNKFSSCLAWSLRWWFLSLPPGIGLATGRAIIKLLFGIPANYSGVYSAGNGPAMRAATIGAVCCRDIEKLTTMITASTRMTHTDPRAVIGALAIALAAAYMMRNPIDELPNLRHAQLFQYWQQLATDDVEWQRLVAQMKAGVAQNLTVADFAYSLGLTHGISGYIYHTVPIALYAWLHHFGDFITSITSVLELGGDTDTVGAITGALAGMVTGEAGIPISWIDGIADWPRSPALLRRVADAVACVIDGQIEHFSKPIRYFYPAVPIRNIFFLLIILVHGLCRPLPMLINPLRDRYFN